MPFRRGRRRRQLSELGSSPTVFRVPLAPRPAELASLAGPIEELPDEMQEATALSVEKNGKLAHYSFESLAFDPFWRPVIRGTARRAAIYAYCVLSGLPWEEALELAIGSESFNAIPLTTLGEVKDYFDRAARLVWQRAALVSGVNRFWAVRIAKEIAENAANKPMERLEAVRMALQLDRLVGDAIPIAELHRTVFADGSESITARISAQESVSATIRQALDSFPRGTGLVIATAEASPAPDEEEEEEE